MIGRNSADDFVENRSSGRRPGKLTDIDRERIVELHAEGKGRNELAALLGVDPATITYWARRLDIRFDESQTAEATAAPLEQLKRRRLDSEASTRLDHSPASEDSPPMVHDSARVFGNAKPEDQQEPMRPTNPRSALNCRSSTCASRSPRTTPPRQNCLSGVRQTTTSILTKRHGRDPETQNRGPIPQSATYRCRIAPPRG
ncbi:helix-turn-helix domain-containing protein [Nocardia xishanensis]